MNWAVYVKDTLSLGVDNDCVTWTGDLNFSES